MKKLADAYFKDNGTIENEFYLFVIDNMEAGTAGMMPQGYAAGFISDKNFNASTIAHELDHGIFNFDHSWLMYPSMKEGTGLNLMDYADSTKIAGTSLFFRQWQQMASPGFPKGWRKDERESKYVTWSKLEGTVLGEIPGKKGEAVSFYSPSGVRITIEGGKDFTFDKNGYLIGFAIEEERYIAIQDKGKNVFKGYYKDAKQNENSSYSIENVISYQSKSSTTIDDPIYFSLGISGENEDCSQPLPIVNALEIVLTNSETGGVDLVEMSISITNHENLNILSTEFVEGDYLNCLSGRAKELYKYGIDFYSGKPGMDGQPMEFSKEFRKVLFEALKGKKVLLHSIDGDYSKQERIQFDNLIAYGFEEFVASINNASSSIIYVELKDIDKFKDLKLLYAINEKIGANCFSLDGIKSIVNADLEKLTLTDILQIWNGSGIIHDVAANLECLLSKLKFDEDVWNKYNFNHEETSFLTGMIKFILPTAALSVINQESSDLATACTCGAFNGVVAAVGDIIGLVKMITDPDAEIKIKAFFKEFPPIDEITSKIAKEVKEFHGKIEIIDGSSGQSETIVDKYKVSYAACNDIIVVASLFVGVGELKALAEGQKLATVMRAAIKTTVKAPGVLLKDAVVLAGKTIKNLDGLALKVLEEMIQHEGLVKMLKFDGAKAFLMNKQLDRAILEFEGSKIKYFKVGEETPAARVIFETDGVLDEAGDVVHLEILEEADGKLVGRVKGAEELAIDVATATEKQLDDIFAALQNNPPFKYAPNSLEHKAERWAQYKIEKGAAAKDYATWSNIYNSNMTKATKAHLAADEVMASISWGQREVTVQAGNYTRRMDIADKFAKKGVEVKSYETGKVYATQAIIGELNLDKYLIDIEFWQIEWVFKGCEPSQPLGTLLEQANITIKLIQ